MKMYSFGFEIVVLDVWIASRLPSFAGVRPQQVIYDSFIFSVGLVIDFDRLRDHLNLVDAGQCGADSSMHAEDAVVNDCGDRHFLKYSIGPLEKRPRIIDILLQLRFALITEAHASIDSNILMAPS